MLCRRCESSNLWTSELKVFTPVLCPRVEESFCPTRIRIEARDIGTLVPIAVRACQCQILKLCLSAMLPGKNVFDVETDRGDRRLRQSAVLTGRMSSVGYSLSRGCVHGLLPVVHLENRARLGLQERKKVEQRNELLVLGSLFRGETSIRTPIRQFVDTILGLVVRANGKNGPGGVGGQRLAYRIDHSL